MQLSKLIASPLFKRAVGTVLFTVPTLWLVVIDNVPFLVFVSIITIIAAYEFYRMMSHSGHRPFYLFGIVAALLFVADAYFEPDIMRLGLTAVLAFSLVWMGVDEAHRRFTNAESGRNTFLDWSLTLVGALYTGGILSHIILLRSLPNGTNLLLTTIFGTIACDSAAYLIGSNFGKRKFFPHISPKKTWEGTIGGFLSAIVVVMLAASFLGIGALYALGWGALIGAFVITGDLVESRIKREAGVKDAGSLVPEQGGVLDVIDGLLFAVVVSYYYVVWVMQVS